MVTIASGLESVLGEIYMSGVLRGEGGGEGSGLRVEFPDEGRAAGMREETVKAGVSWESWVGSRNGGKCQTLRGRGGGVGYMWRWA
jgi:hypothetical protein